MNSEEKERFMQDSLELVQNADFSVDEYNSALKELSTIKEDEDLPVRVQRFCAEYVSSYSGEQAARAAGYPPWNAQVFGARLLANRLVQKEIERLQKKITKKLQITQERVLAEYAHVGYSNFANYYDEEGKLIPIHKLDREHAAAIQEIVYDRRGNMKGYKLIGKTVALDALSKTLGMFDKDSERTLPVDFKQFCALLPPEIQENIRVGMAKRIGQKK